MHVRKIKGGHQLRFDTPEGVTITLHLKRQRSGKFKAMISAPKCVRISEEPIPLDKRGGRGKNFK